MAQPTARVPISVTAAAPICANRRRLNDLAAAQETPAAERALTLQMPRHSSHPAASPAASATTAPTCLHHQRHQRRYHARPEENNAFADQPWLRLEFAGDDEQSLDVDLESEPSFDDSGRLVTAIQGLLAPIRIATNITDDTP